MSKTRNVPVRIAGVQMDVALGQVAANRDRMLDQLENAPTLQQEEAKRHGKKRVRGMADK